jgi:hypothetical protein
VEYVRFTISQCFHSIIFILFAARCSVSAAIVKKHGGILGVTSSGIPGEGCVFYIEIDATALDEAAIAATAVDNRLTASSSGVQMSAFRTADSFSQQSTLNLLTAGSTSRRALVVDDSAMNVKMVSRGIRPYFDTVTEVNTSTRIVLWVRI